MRFDTERRALRVEVEPDADATYTIDFVGTLEGVDAGGERIAVDGLDEKQVRAIGRHTRKYSDRIGAVLATAAGPSAEYTLTGRELYVRAVVTSSRPPADPVWEGQRQQAWTQPVGWEHRVRTELTPRPAK